METNYVLIIIICIKLPLYSHIVFSAVRPDRMRGGRNKFGPMYKRDRALKQQAIRQRQQMLAQMQCQMGLNMPPGSGSNMQSLPPGSYSHPSMSPDTYVSGEPLDIKPNIAMLGLPLPSSASSPPGGHSSPMGVGGGTGGGGMGLMSPQQPHHGHTPPGSGGGNMRPMIQQESNNHITSPTPPHLQQPQQPHVPPHAISSSASSQVSSSPYGHSYSSMMSPPPPMSGAGNSAGMMSPHQQHPHHNTMSEIHHPHHQQHTAGHMMGEGPGGSLQQPQQRMDSNMAQDMRDMRHSDLTGSSSSSRTGDNLSRDMRDLSRELHDLHHQQQQQELPQDMSRNISPHSSNQGNTVNMPQHQQPPPHQHHRGSLSTASSPSATSLTPLMPGSHGNSAALHALPGAAPLQQPAHSTADPYRPGGTNSGGEVAPLTIPDVILDLQKNEPNQLEIQRKLRNLAEAMLKEQGQDPGGLATGGGHNTQGIMDHQQQQCSGSGSGDLTRGMLQIVCKLCDQALFLLVEWARGAEYFRELKVRD